MSTVPPPGQQPGSLPEGSYYVSNTGEVSGPYDAATLAGYVTSGHVAPHSQISRDGGPWGPASDVPGLFSSAPGFPSAPGYAAAGSYPTPPAGYAPQGVPPYAPQGALPYGQIRSTGISILLFFVTFGIYGYVYYYKVHDEMKRHTGDGIGGGIALLLALLVGVASPFLVSSEVGGLYRRVGREQPVSGATGLWYLPGMFIIVGPFIWFIKTNNALNEYWASVGAPRP